MSLTEKQRKHLRALAHTRKPVVMVGSGGFSEAVAAELEQALLAHELLKIRVRAGEREARNSVIADILARTGAVQVQRIGHVLTLYRRNPYNPRVQLP